MKISIEYCTQWNYEPRARSLRDDLIVEFKDRFDNDMFYADDLDGADFLDYLKATYRIGGDVYRQFRNTAAFFGSNPGDKSTMIKINLGILDE